MLTSTSVFQSASVAGRTQQLFQPCGKPQTLAATFWQTSQNQRDNKLCMTFTKKDLTLLVPLLLFLFLGFYLAYSVDFLQYEKVFSISVKWFILPTIIVATYYAYYSTFGYDKKSALWRKILGLLVLTLIFSLMILRAFQGYLTYYNCNFGPQTKLTIKGKIPSIYLPNPREENDHHETKSIPALPDCIMYVTPKYEICYQDILQKGKKINTIVVCDTELDEIEKIIQDRNRFGYNIIVLTNSVNPTKSTQVLCWNWFREEGEIINSL